MYLGRVIGSVWATVKHPGFVGARMLLIQPLTPTRQPTGKQLICLDCTGAGVGETIYYVKGKEATLPFLPLEPPADSTVVGIVDSIHLKAAPGPAAEVEAASAALPSAPPSPNGMAPASRRAAPSAATPAARPPVVRKGKRC